MTDKVLLISAVYVCRKGHKLLAHDEYILKLFPPVMIPFVLLHKTGFTRDFVEMVIAFCRRGINFCELESIVLERRLDHHSQRMQLLYLHYKACKKNSEDQLFARSEMFRKELDCPSNNIISKCFLTSFLQTEEFYLSSIHALEVSESISFDHTFKVATNIGHLRNDGIWVPQYDSLFLVLASNGNVLTWQLTKGTSLGQVSQILQDLRDRAASQKKILKYVYVDDCCKLRKTIQNILGSEVIVRLDLFHAVQRITRTLPKKHPLFNKCVADFRLVFRTDGDVGKQRLLPTPAIHRLRSNLNSFVEKWKNVPDDPILTSSSMIALNNLEKHIKFGCLSNIPPGMGTNKNERFHRQLKAVVHRSRIGILLAYALLSVLIHAHNNSSIVAGKKVVESVVTYSSSETKYPPIGVCPKQRVNCTGDEVMWDRDESLEIPSPEKLLFYHTAISKVALARAFKSMNLNHLFKKASMFKLMSPDESSPEKASPTLEVLDIERSLMMNGLKLKHIAPDGNCFFSAVAASILSAPAQWNDCLRRLDYVLISEGNSYTELGVCLRRAFVTELLSNPQRYRGFLECQFQENYEAEANRFLQDKYFDSALGDCMPRAMSVVLQAPVVVFSDVATEPQYFAISDIITSKATVLLVHRSELKHYDVAIPVAIQHCSSATTQPPASVSCSCGINRKGTAVKSCYQSPIYSTRCKCFNNSQPCTSKCRCINCDNINGRRLENAKHSEHSMRKRRSHQWQGELPTQKRFASDKGQDLQGGVWSDFETILLQEIHPIHTSIEEISAIFNTLVTYSKSVMCSVPLTDTIIFRQKTPSQISSKLAYLAKAAM